MKYKNFNASVYCPVGTIIDIKDFNQFEKDFDRISKNITVGKVYLETYRGGVTISKEQMVRVKEFFLSKGIETSGGITTDDVDNGDGGFSPFCYTSERTRSKLREVVTITSELFDEFILDDFYFTNCRCEDCIKAKGNRSWSSFRLDLMKDISENIIVKTAKEVNPNVNTIIKYPNWYDHYQDAGYNLEDEPKIFDYIYTGTETRNPLYAQQHLPKYLSYFIIRYLEHVKPGKNLGGWFDPYECTYNLTSYIDQGYLTLFAKAKEAMLFNLGSLTIDPTFSTFAPTIGQVFSDMDSYLDQLGTPTGIACYLPYHSYGEDYLHNYVGMCGIPLDPYPDYPIDAMNVFLTESAAYDKDIITKVKASLLKGADVIVTSGFAKKVGEALHDIMHVNYSSRKAIVNQYAYSPNGGVSYGGNVEALKSILIPQLEFFTNDVWELIGGLGEDNNFPILLKTKYGQGRMFVLTIPDDFGDLYHYPRAILNTIREAFHKNARVQLDSVSKVTLFTYDNDTFVLRSFNAFVDKATIHINDENITLLDLERGHVINGVTSKGITTFNLELYPSTNLILKIQK
ncbi:MAG TPA: hypothetical protein VHQ24_05540 [Lachnospiraceae bacterium]|nr:hypothetical protein [Lachnospiraceae bacterium]